jgi:predicted PurR-regulated permease PerM
MSLRPSWQERAAWLLLCGALVGVGLYILANYLRALAWALVLAIAIWPSYDRVRRQASPLVAKEVLPVLFTALVGLAIFLPFATLAVDALREVREVVDYGRKVEESGIPVPDFVIQLPYVGQWVADWWREHLSHAGWAKEIVQQMNSAFALMVWESWEPSARYCAASRARSLCIRLNTFSARMRLSRKTTFSMKGYLK